MTRQRLCVYQFFLRTAIQTDSNTRDCFCMPHNKYFAPPFILTVTTITDISLTHNGIQSDNWEYRIRGNLTKVLLKFPPSCDIGHKGVAVLPKNLDYATHQTLMRHTCPLSLRTLARHRQLADCVSVLLTQCQRQGLAVCQLIVVIRCCDIK